MYSPKFNSLTIINDISKYFNTDFEYSENLYKLIRHSKIISPIEWYSRLATYNIIRPEQKKICNKFMSRVDDNNLFEEYEKYYNLYILVDFHKIKMNKMHSSFAYGINIYLTIIRLVYELNFDCDLHEGVIHLLNIFHNENNYIDTKTYICDSVSLYYERHPEKLEEFIEKHPDKLEEFIKKHPEKLEELIEKHPELHIKIRNVMKN